MPVTAGTFFQRPAKSPAQFPAGDCEITLAGLDMESKAPQFHGTAGTILLKAWHLSPAVMVTNDWCINLKVQL